MSLHQKDWLKLGLGATLLGLTGGLAGIGIPGLMGGAAGATGAGAAGIDAATAGAGIGNAAIASGAGASLAAPTAASGAAGLGHALTSLGMEAGKDTAKGAIVSGMLSPLTQQKATVYGSPIQMQQQTDPFSMFR